MLNHITNHEYFSECIKKVKYAYWPYDKDYNQEQYLRYSIVKPEDLKDLFTKEEKDSESALYQNNTNTIKIENIHNTVNKIKLDYIIKTCESKCYQTADGQEEYIVIPFLDKFHTLFSKRKWDEPYFKPSNTTKELLRLAPPKTRITDKPKNYSANYGNYCHFINVVAALSHFIYFFSEEKNKKWVNEYFENSWDIIHYVTGTSVRKFKLMLAGFYHDIGKTVVDHRHGMEGYMILSSYQSNALRSFTLLSDYYYNDNTRIKYNLDREDLLFIADLVYYHDLYGTLSTGENGYVRLINMIERVERYCRKEIKSINDKEKTEELSKTGKQHIFDLWLLNVADLMVSRERKWDEQKEWTMSDLGDQTNEIQKFFNSGHNNSIAQGSDLLHDLKISFNFFDIYINDQYQNPQLPFKQAVLKCSYYHNVARIRKIVKSSLFGKTEELKKTFNQNNDLSPFYQEILEISKYALDKTIDTAIRSGSDYAEFSKRFSWVGQLDYSLKYFQKLANYAIESISKQLDGLINNTQTSHSGWISESIELLKNDRTEWCKINARYFIDNYIQIIVQTIDHLLFRDTFYEHILNFEFEDAGNRLTDDKIKRILFFEGPARSTKSMMLILETIFIY